MQAPQINTTMGLSDNKPNDTKALSDRTASLEKIRGVFHNCISSQKVAEYYNSWEEYDEDDCSPENYKGPLYSARYAHKYMQGEVTKNIIDVGAGTGRIAEELQTFGAYSRIDALEPAVQFFENSTNKRLYTNHFTDFVGHEPTSIKDDTYDVAVSCGTFVEGHIPCVGVKEFIRIVKPGGFAIIAMRKQYLDSVADYRDRMEPFLDELQLHGKCQVIESADEPDFYCGMCHLRQIEYTRMYRTEGRKINKIREEQGHELLENMLSTESKLL